MCGVGLDLDGGVVGEFCIAVDFVAANGLDGCWVGCECSVEAVEDLFV